MSFNVGETVGPYRILEQLGQGGMASVFKAYHASLDRYVAIKVLHPAFLEDKNFLARFQREARVVAKLEHPNIVPIYDYAEHEGRPYLVMKYIEGETLKARLGNGGLPHAEVLRIVEAVGAALAYAHRQGILHRDIKPSNVILGIDGTIYLADFGLARIAQSGESTLTSDMVIGTPQYISPEQATGKRELDEGTDIYSFGVMLYEMTVGRVPFSADTPFSVIHDHIYTPLPLPTSVNPSLAPDVERVLLKALAKDRADRYVNVAALVEAFREAWQNEAAPPPKPVLRTADTGTIPPVPKAAVPAAVAAPAKPKTSGWRTAALIILMMLCCGFVFFALRGLRASNGQTVRGQIQSALGDPTLQAARQEIIRNPADPHAHLDLAAALWTAGDQNASLAEVNKMLGMPAADQAFLTGAAQTLSAEQNWTGSALVHMKIKADQEAAGAQASQDNLDGLHESLYKAAAYDGLFAQIKPEQIGAVSPPLLDVVQGRHSLLNGKASEAARFYNHYLALNAQIPEGQLLDAEIKIQAGDQAGARLVLTKLSTQSDLPRWVMDFASGLLKTIP